MEPHLARNTPTMIRRSTTDTVKHSEYRKVSPAPSQPRRVLSSSLPSPVVIRPSTLLVRVECAWASRARPS